MLPKGPAGKTHEGLHIDDDVVVPDERKSELASCSYCNTRNDTIQYKYQIFVTKF